MDFLQRRMDELDQWLSTGPHSEGWLLEHFVTVMRFYTNTSMGRTDPGVFDPAVIRAVDSDEIVATSPTVSALAMSELSPIQSNGFANGRDGQDAISERAAAIC